MIKQIELSKQPKRKINRFCKLLDKFNTNASRKVKRAHELGFNPKVDNKTGKLRGFICRQCGKSYRAMGWVERHTH